MKLNGHKICKEWLSEDPIQALSLEWMQGEVHVSQGTEALIRVTQRGSALFPRTRCFEAKISNGLLHLIDGRKQAFPLGINFHRTSLHIVLPPTVLQRLLINGWVPALLWITFLPNTGIVNVHPAISLYLGMPNISVCNPWAVGLQQQTFVQTISN